MTQAKEYPPIATADGMAVKLGMVLYQTEVSVSPYSDDEDRNYANVVAYRVTQVNLQHRHVRMRCIKGCETLLKLNEGCARSRFYGNKLAATRAANQEVRKGIAELEAKRKKYESLIKAARRITPMVGPIPPETLE